MKKMRMLILAALVLLAGLFAAPARATDHFETDTAKTAAADPALEKKYSDEYERKVKAQTERADESLSSLFRGVFVVFGAVTLIGVFALLRTGKQQRELDRLKADLAAKG
jgi:hypothetical protein